MIPLLLDLQRATHATLHHLSAELADLRLVPSELNALANLGRADGGATTISALATAIGSRPTTLTGILDRLEQRGLAERVPHEHDRRTMIVRLTADGTATARRILTAMDTLTTTALANLPEGAGQTAAVVLRALTEASR